MVTIIFNFSLSFSADLSLPTKINLINHQVGDESNYLARVLKNSALL